MAVVAVCSSIVMDYGEEIGHGSGNFSKLKDFRRDRIDRFMYGTYP